MKTSDSGPVGPVFALELLPQLDGKHDPRSHTNYTKKTVFRDASCDFVDRALSVAPKSLKITHYQTSLLGRCLIITLFMLAVLSLSIMTALSQSNSSKAKTGSPLGPKTEAFFEEVSRRKQQTKPGSASQEDPFSIADLNRDGKCNRTDLKLFRRVMGKCSKPGSSPLISLADLDGDNCVTSADKRTFLQLWRDCRSKVKTNAP